MNKSILNILLANLSTLRGQAHVSQITFLQYMSWKHSPRTNPQQNCPRKHISQVHDAIDMIFQLQTL